MIIGHLNPSDKSLTVQTQKSSEKTCRSFLNIYSLQIISNNQISVDKTCLKTFEAM